MCSPHLMHQVYEAIERRRLSRRSMLGAVGAAALGAAILPAMATRAAAAPADGRSIVDLSHVLTPSFPVWPGSRPFEMRTLSTISGGTGSLGSIGMPTSVFYTAELRLEEHTGTHVDAPAHADADGITVERIPPEDLSAPVVVIDIAAKARADNDALLTRQDLQDWEAEHGTIPRRALVAMHSGWQFRLGQPGAFTNQDAFGVQHTPGFDPEAVEFLIHERDIVALGSDTLSIDAGNSNSYGAHLAALGSGRYAVEVLANLDRLPPVGASVVVGAPTHAGGSGGPARVLAFV